MEANLFAGRYQLLELIGEGGAAQVYRATHTRLDRVVALKLLRGSYSHDPNFLQRFENEARGVARLSHPNIVNVFDYDQAEDQYFIAMEYVPGSLRDYLNTHGPLSEEETRRLTGGILQGLAVAHEAGLVHRDLKPQNVLMTRGGEPKITDFGIAKAMGSTGMTRTGTVFGTPHYMSPEQVRGQAVGPRSDLYAVGVMMYEMLSGRLPFDGDEPMRIMYAHVFDQPAPLAEVAPNVSPEVAEVVHRALAKDPQERYREANEMCRALGVAAGTGATGRAPTVDDNAPTLQAAQITPATGLNADPEIPAQPVSQHPIGGTVQPPQGGPVGATVQGPALGGDPRGAQPTVHSTTPPLAPGTAAGGARSRGGGVPRWPVLVGALLLLALLGGGGALLLSQRGGGDGTPTATAPVVVVTPTSVIAIGGAPTKIVVTDPTAGPTNATTKPTLATKPTSGAPTSPAATPPPRNTPRPTAATQANNSAPLAGLITAGALPADADPNGTLVYDLVNADPGRADPQLASTPQEFQVTSLLFQGLLTLDAENRPAQNAAESYTLSEDNLTYTFKIRREMTYSDGQPVTAGNFEYALKRGCDPNLQAQYASILYDIVGCRDYHDGSAGRDAVGVKATDNQTLQIKLTRAASYFPYVMTLPITYPSREDLVRRGGDTWSTSPGTAIGNGPFRLISYTANQEWVFERNGGYFRGKPRLARITIRTDPNVQTLLDYQQDKFAVITVYPGLLPQVEGNAALTDQIVREPEPSTYYFGMNNSKPPFNNPQARQAIAYALNRELYLKQLRNGSGIPAGSLIPPGVPGYQKGSKQTYDPEKARKLLSDAGYPNGKDFPEIELGYSQNDTTSQQVAEFWARQLKEVLNIPVTATPQDPNELSQRVADKDRQPELYFQGWIQDYPHPQNWVTLLFDPRQNLAPAGWNDADFVDLITRAGLIQNIDEAAPTYAQADARLAELAPAAFYEHGESIILAKPTVKGYVSYPGDPLGFIRQAEQVYVTR